MFRILLKILAHLSVLILVLCVFTILVARTQKPHDWLAYIRAVQAGVFNLYVMDTSHISKPIQPLGRNWITTGDHNWSVDGRLVFNVGGWVETSEILVFDPSTMSFIDPIRDRKGREFQPVWSFDGRTLAYSGIYNDANTQNVYLANLANSQIQQITTDEQGGGEMPAWSPDGRIAYVLRDQSYYTDIVIYDPETDTQARIGSENAEYPHWSPDNLLTFRSAVVDDSGWSSIFFYNGSSEVFIDGISTQSMNWSAGGKLVYSSPALYPDTDDIHVYDPVDQTVTDITQQTTLAELSPSWTPTGDLIFIAEVGNQYDIHLLDLETGLITNLTNSPQNEYYATWMP